MLLYYNATIDLLNEPQWKLLVYVKDVDVAVINKRVASVLVDTSQCETF